MRAWWLAVAAVALAVPALLHVPPVAAADGPGTFGQPTADSSFIDGIDFRQPVTIERTVTRAELLFAFGDGIGQTVISVEPPVGSGSSTLAYHLDPAADGHLYPGTRIVARWRLTGEDPTDVAIGPPLELRFADDPYVRDSEKRASTAAGTFGSVREVAVRDGVQHVEFNVRIADDGTF